MSSLIYDDQLFTDLYPPSIKLVFAPFAPRFSHRGWLHAQLLLHGEILAPEPCPVRWAQGVWAVPMLSVLCSLAEKRGPRRSKISVDWTR
jgi:hypothetical protein